MDDKNATKCENFVKLDKNMYSQTGGKYVNYSCITVNKKTCFPLGIQTLLHQF